MTLALLLSHTARTTVQTTYSGVRLTLIWPLIPRSRKPETSCDARRCADYCPIIRTMSSIKIGGAVSLLIPVAHHTAFACVISAGTLPSVKPPPPQYYTRLENKKKCVGLISCLYSIHRDNRNPVKAVLVE